MAEANDATSRILGPNGSPLITSGLDEQFKLLKNVASDISGGPGKTLVEMPSARLKKMASQMNSMRPGMHRQAPSFFHPLFEAINLQLPTKTREINQWARHYYKCLAPGSLVLMADGTLKEIENVKIGESVVTHDGTTGVVNEVFERKIKTKAMKIRSVGLPDIVATKNHPFYALDKSAEDWRWGRIKTPPSPSWKFAIQIKKGDFLLSPKMVVEAEETVSAGAVAVRTSSNLLRLVGFYAAEGCVSQGKGGRYVRFSFNSKEKNTIGAETEKLLAEFFGGKTHWYDDTRSNASELRLWNQDAADFFSSACPGNARTKKVGTDVLGASVEDQMEFLRAFVLGDGHVDRDTGANPGQISINLASRDLSSQVQQMFIRCGMAAVIYHWHPTCNYKGELRRYEAWQVKVSALDAERLIGKVKESESKSRNNSHHWFFGDHMVSRIKSVETVEYDDFVYNLNVGPNNSFVANGAIVHNTDGYVGTMIDLHSEFPLTEMRIVCDDPKVKRFFEILFFDILKGQKLLSDINLEWWKLANVFPFGAWDDEKGIWTSFNLLNPDFVEVEKSSLAGEPVLKLDPDDNLKRIVQSRQPRELYDQLAKIEGGELVNLIARGEKIPLNKFRVSHLAFKLSPYETVGTPIMFRAFKPLIQKDLIRRVQQAVYERHILPLKLIKVGSDTMPANPEAIKQVREAFDELSSDLSAWFVYHHAISAEYVSSSGKIHPFSDESKWVREEILAALLGNEAMVGGTGPNFATASIGMQILINRYLRNQQVLIDWIKDTVFRPVAIAQDFKRNTEFGEEYIVPDVEFGLMKLKDDAQMKGLMKELMKTNLISRQTFYNYMGLDSDREKKQIEREQSEMKNNVLKQIKPTPPGGPAAGGEGGGAPMGGGGGGEGPEIPGSEPPTPGERMPASEGAPGQTEGGQGPGPGGLPEAA